MNKFSDEEVKLMVKNIADADLLKQEKEDKKVLRAASRAFYEEHGGAIDAINKALRHKKWKQDLMIKDEYHIEQRLKALNNIPAYRVSKSYELHPIAVKINMSADELDYNEFITLLKKSI